MGLCARIRACLVRVCGHCLRDPESSLFSALLQDARSPLGVPIVMVMPAHSLTCKSNLETRNAKQDEETVRSSSWMSFAGEVGRSLSQAVLGCYINVTI